MGRLTKKQQFINDFLAYAGHKRALESKRYRSRSTVAPAYDFRFRSKGRSPKPIEDLEATLEDAFDEIEPSIESEIDPDY